ncbi:MAG: acyloxyacyl hydrolase [Betaproteobacteria bacterium]|nr:acyloxyacyl hydrolase [Betaproteobacteria bacterium]
MKNNATLWAAGALAWAVMSAPSYAIDGASVEVGNGDGTDMGRVGVQWDWKTRWLQGQNWHLGGYWDFALGYWHRGSPPGLNEDITDIGLTPVLRLQRNDLRGPYLEAGIGFHLLSKTSIGDKRLSTAFQFGDHVGAGYRFGPKAAYDVSYRFQHLSNAGIKKPNNGIEFHQIRLQYHF